MGDLLPSSGERRDYRNRRSAAEACFSSTGVCPSGLRQEQENIVILTEGRNGVKGNLTCLKSLYLVEFSDSKTIEASTFNLR